ncbi:MAG TPA: hypothetical protein VFH15_13445 [Pyrinomonadaceae bacterium]|nr:hypothetical protein [Pyrinomonadaceae bacterium]
MSLTWSGDTAADRVATRPQSYTLFSLRDFWGTELMGERSVHAASNYY